MTVEQAVRGLGGFFVLASAVLAHYHSQRWLFFTGFVGANLPQSAFTNRRPAMTLLEKAGLKKAVCSK